MPFLWLILPVGVFAVVLWVMWDDPVGKFRPAIAFSIAAFLFESAVSGAASLCIPQISTHVHRVAVVKHELVSPPVMMVDDRGNRAYRFYYWKRGAITDETAKGDVTLHAGANVLSAVVTSTTVGETDCRDAPGFGYRLLRHLVFWDPDQNCALSQNRAQTVKRYDLYLDSRGVAG